MKEEVSNCGRANDLISFLYGELNDSESQTFQRHLRECAQCNAEFAGFSDVRQSVVAWRNESLGAMASPERVPNRVANMAGAAGRTEQTPSALSALREFFNLSPLWLKGAVAFASLLFCVFAGLAVSRWREKPTVAVVPPATPAYSQTELDALVDQRVKAELERIRNAGGPEQKSVLTADNASPKNSDKRVPSHSVVVASASNQKARRPLSKTEREQLAADLRLITAKNDSELSLLDDRLNQ